jgi:hypothetical protein
VKTAKVCEATRVLWLHSAAWMAREVLATGVGLDGYVRVGKRGRLYRSRPGMRGIWLLYLSLRGRGLLLFGPRVAGEGGGVWWDAL